MNAHEDFFEFGRRLVQELRQQGDTASIILHFDASFGDQRRSLEHLVPLIGSEITARNMARQQFERTSTAGSERMPLFRQFKSHEAAAETFAGTLFVVVNRAIFDTAAQLGFSSLSDLNYGRQLGSTYLIQVIRAASNNFRHFEEWWNPENQATANINLLRAAGVLEPFNRNVCADVFQILGWRSADEVINDVRAAMIEIFENSP